MTMATGVYASAKLKLVTGLIDLDTDAIYLALVTNSYTPDFTTHDFFNDVTNEVVGTGYVAGGALLAGITAALTGTEFRFSATAPTWPGSTITARGGVVYKKRGGASSADELICACLFAGGLDIATSGGLFTATPDATGILGLL